MRIIILDDLECNVNEYVFNYINKLNEIISDQTNLLGERTDELEEQKDLVVKLGTQLLFAQTEASELKNKNITL